VGRASLFSGAVFAVIGFIGGVYALSFGLSPDLPAPILFLLCPAALLAALSPTAETTSDFMWMIVLLNTVVYGALGLFISRFFKVDDEK
jgi:hypothetical protein